MSYEMVMHISHLMISTGLALLAMIYIHVKIMPLPEVLRRLKAFINGGFYD